MGKNFYFFFPPFFIPISLPPRVSPMREKFSSRENSSDVAFGFFLSRLGDNFFPQTRTEISAANAWRATRWMTVADSSYTTNVPLTLAENDSGDELKHKPNPLLARALLSLPPWTFRTFGRRSFFLQGTTVRRKPHAVHGDIRISFIHTNFGTNLDLRKPRRREVYESRSISNKLSLTPIILYWKLVSNN